ncbi:MAG: hypothetical protein EZS28_021918 [Streblomastix strix]|uniref:Tyr recombinase domain-containing protein n=1 Tax=Streblomastix strix TaxID=222440 RepID=A0A5J4VJ85_9EUKA|nr:MAG: hypothetical protein EZS28_021918 [Streblomastix strix]
MSEVHRSTYTLMDDGSCQLQTDLVKGAKLIKKHLQFLRSTNRIAKDEELSKAMHRITDNVGIPKGYTVTSIRKAAITKAVAQGASNTDISRLSSHSEGQNTVVIYYDTNLK